jgi:predicted permease
MTHDAPPRLGRWLLRLLPLGERRADVEDDLMELFESRTASRGARYARRRYFSDVLSLWRGGRRSGRRLARQSEVVRSSRFSPTEVLQDLTYAARMLRRSPAVVLMAIVGLALAISVGTSMFSILNIIAFRSTGIRDSSALVSIMRAYRNGIGDSWSHAEYLQIRDHARTVKVEAALRDGASFSTSPDADAGQGASLVLVSGGYLAMMHPRVSLGRILTPADGEPGAQPVVVVNHAWWSRTLGADPSIVGRSVWLNGRPFVVIGVTERGFAGTADTPPAMWTTLENYHVLHGGLPLDRRSSTSVSLASRLSPGVPLAQVEAELTSIVQSADLGPLDLLDPNHPLGAGPRGDYARAPAERVTGVRLFSFGGRAGKNAAQVALIVGVVFTAIGLVLVLACANVTNLLLASAIARRTEIGLRIALGARQARIVRQLLTESLSLGLIAGAVGLLFTVWLLPTLAGVVGVPETFDVRPDGRAYGFLCFISILAGLGAGLAPSKGALRDARWPTRGGGASGGDSRRSRRQRAVLVGAQAAASMVLLVLAALLARGAAHAARLDIGYDASGLMTISPAFGRGPYDGPRAQGYWDLALERVRALPSVQSSALAEVPPFSGSSRVTIFRRAGGRYTINHNDTQAGYFETLGLRVLAGRTYTPAEVSSRAPVAVISEGLARDFFPGESPVGQPLGRILEGSEATIIGVVANAITARLRDPRAAAVYQPIQDMLAARMVVRASGPSEALIKSLQSTFQSIDPRVRVGITKVSDGLDRQLAEPRALSTMAGLLAAVALALALVGLYGVTAFVTGQRRQEISVRIALGASGSDVMRLLVRDSLRPVLYGLAAGAIGAALGSRVLIGVLYGLSPADPLTFAVALIVLLAASTGAVVLPTRRAAAVDPAAVLREV